MIAAWRSLATAGPARTGVLSLPHGEVRTPAFMPVGTAGTVKGLTPEEVAGTGSDMLLANTYHLWNRPGHERVAALGGLHRMMGWDRPILTDSGGYQIFSFREKARLTDEGVRFRDPYDGEYRFMSPEICVGIQETLGVDVAMALDECIAWPAEREAVIASTERTTRWLRRCMEARTRPSETALFGIVQGGFHPDLRVQHARELRDLELDGYAIGGLSVGEPQADMLAMLDLTLPELPTGRVRYLMGVGTPHDLVEAASRGVDLFDCVLPTRSGRFGQVFTRHGLITIKHARFRDDDRPLDPDCACYTCRAFSRAYLRHLHTSKEVLAPRLLTLHNLTFYQSLMARTRTAISDGAGALDALRGEVRGWSGGYRDPSSAMEDA